MDDFFITDRKWSIIKSFAFGDVIPVNKRVYLKVMLQRKSDCTKYAMNTLKCLFCR